MEKECFFTQDRDFYRQLFSLLIVVALQNLVAYSVNMADNIMLGSYSQNALSGAAVVNQIFFLVQQLTLSIGDSLVALGAQYWGQKRPQPIRTLTGTALKLAAGCGIVLILLCTILARPILTLFTPDEAILAEGLRYLSVIKFTFLLFLVTNVLLASLRSVKTVQISFSIAVVSLIINVFINYALIFGHFGCPELGIVGAATGTLIARSIELLIVLIYLWKGDKKLRLLSDFSLFRKDKLLSFDYRKTAVPVIFSSMLWAVSVPLQTAVLGHLSSDAIAANSVATTFYQYLKVIVVAMSSSSAVMIGSAIGKGEQKRIRSDARTLSVIDLGLGACLALILFLLRGPLLSFYALTDSAMVMADHLIIIMSVVMVGMSYQMPVGSGIIRGGGDVKFMLYLNLISVWCIVTPLSFASAFWWRWPVEWVVLMLQSDQIFKCIPIFLRFRTYRWARVLTRD